MSGKQRWMDSLPDADEPQSYDKAALHQLYWALTFGGFNSDRSVEKSQSAAAHIVRWRKSLGVDSARAEYDSGSLAVGDPLWCAIAHVSVAALGPNDEGTANHLRFAEAALREYWKENK